VTDFDIAKKKKKEKKKSVSRFRGACDNVTSTWPGEWFIGKSAGDD